MQITLENETGKSRGRLVLKTGQFMRVGRKLPADLTGNEDDFMSSLHFLIECKADSCRISDMESRNGTFLNGARITEAILRDGDVIVAGRTRFRVHIQVEERAEAPRVGSPDFTGVLGEGTLDLPHQPRDLRELLSPQHGEHLYALLDAARDDRVLELLRETKERYQSLYEGHQGEDLANFAPYLVELPKGSPLLESLINEGWGQSWGVYLMSSKSFEEVRKHFRHFLLVQTEDGKQLYFRFYDPRVLRVFLPTCTRSESSEFFGPIGKMLVEHKPAHQALCFSDATSHIPQEFTLRLPKPATNTSMGERS